MSLTSPATNPMKTEFLLHVRKADGSCFISKGDYIAGPGQAFDVACDEKLAREIVEALNNRDHLQARVTALELALRNIHDVAVNMAPTASGLPALIRDEAAKALLSPAQPEGEVRK